MSDEFIAVCGQMKEQIDAPSNDDRKNDYSQIFLKRLNSFMSIIDTFQSSEVNDENEYVPSINTVHNGLVNSSGSANKFSGH